MMIQFITLIISLIIQFGTVSPFNMVDLNAENEYYIDDVKARISSNYAGWNSMSDCLSVPNERWVVIMGAQLWGSTRNQVTVLCPLEDIGGGSSSISCSAYSTTDDFVDSVTFNFNNYVQFFTVDSYINNPYLDGFRTYSFGSSSAYSLLYCNTPIYYNDTLVVDSFVLPDIPSFDGHYEPTVAPENLDFTGHSNVTVSNSNITTENGNIIQNILGKMNNAINSLGNIVSSGFNGVFSLLGQVNNNIGSVFGNLFGKISYILYIPSADEIITTFNNSLLGQNMHLFSDVENSVRDNIIITTPDNFVINFSFMFFGANIPFVLDLNGLFGSVLMSRLRSILTAFIYVGCVLLVIHELPHTVQGLNGFGR